MVVGPGITGPPCQTRGGEAPSELVGSHDGPEMSRALTIPLNRPIFPGSRDAHAFLVPPAAEPVVMSRLAASMPKASRTNSFLIVPPSRLQERERVLQLRKTQVAIPQRPRAPAISWSRTRLSERSGVTLSVVGMIRRPRDRNPAPQR